ncbi:hypothetical protein BA190_10155 [Labrys sp. WJW]|uniref:phage baseplate assembly protein V n=1 Tax=Labrys sp. WJW TaxID=1737983 RepID=UPI00082EA605|nr:phage baseplate assembly protein V [Labrys sp. WJW]OCC05256.1 hypothetical protein BA190_10155 [Labrys sp. WJW]
MIIEFLRRMEEMERRLNTAERRLANMFTPGAVAEEEAGKGVRINLGGSDDEPFLSPWIKSGNLSGVTSIPVGKGAQMMVLAPNGDLEQAMAIPWDHTDARGNPAKSGDETVFYQRNGVRFSEQGGVMSIEASSFRIKCGGSTFELSGGGLKMVASDYDFG